MKLHALFFTFLITTPISTNVFADWENSGDLGIEDQYFTDQEENNYSILGKHRLRWSNEDESTIFSSEFYARYDDIDEDRGKPDVREFLLTHAHNNWEFSGGLGKVFWGVSESNHLVDVINQTDLAESNDGESKLGQPLLKVSNSSDWGILDFYLLPYFRERYFPGVDSPLSAGLDLNESNIRYESGAEQKHVDFALRYSQYFGDWDIGLSYFNGTNRDPYLLFQQLEQELETELYYDQIEQVGISVQATIEAWLLKLETINRNTSLESYSAASIGLEYTFFGLADSPTDLGILIEYNYDDREEQFNSFLQDDVFIGARLTPNNVQNTEFLIGFIQDQEESDSQMLFVETSTRLGDSFKIILDARIFKSETPTNAAYAFREADYASLRLEYYY